MTAAELKKQITLIDRIGQKYKWVYVSNDSNTFRVSFKDKLSIYRLDIYLSKMTVCLLPAGDKPVYFKRQSLDSIEAIFKNPYAFEKKRKN